VTVSSRCNVCCCGWTGWKEKDVNNGEYILGLRIVGKGVNNSHVDTRLGAAHNVIIAIVAVLSFYPDGFN